ncbi:MAG: serine protease, partial [Anaerolineales bacterium]
MSNELTNVRLQNLRDFTVQIRRPSDETIVGTGIAVTMDGQVVTCAHVVEAALGAHPRQADGAEVGVYFPQARGGEEKARRATVACCFPQHDDDVVLLQLVGEPSPLAPEQIPVLGTAEASDGHGFRSYGYRRLEKYIAGHAHGVILGCVECPEGFSLQADPVQLESKQINQGMSGAAVLDMERNLVVGIVSEFWLPPDRSLQDRDTAWAVNARVLSLEPLGLELQDEPYPKRAAPQPKTDVEAARAAVAPDLGLAWNNAPAPLEEWVGREELLQAITRDWADPDRRVTGLIGFGGEGKSSLARQSVENILKGDSPPPKSGEGPGVGDQPDG